MMLFRKLICKFKGLHHPEFTGSYHVFDYDFKYPRKIHVHRCPNCGDYKKIMVD